MTSRKRAWVSAALFAVLSGTAVAGCAQSSPMPWTPEAEAAAGFQFADASPGEELWVIERSGLPSSEAPKEESPGTGSMLAKRGTEENVPLPLESTTVRATVAGIVSDVAVVQRFKNPYAEKIEAVYVFPLPHDAAVSGFVMTIGERKIRGIVREREEAKAIYEEAKRQGYVAALLTQARPNIFTQSVANIEPGKTIDVEIRYFNALPVKDGWIEFAFPMVVGPRFNPPGIADGIGAAPRGGRSASGQRTEVPYLKPGERSGHEISLSVEIDAGVLIKSLECPTHEIERTASLESGRARISLARRDAVPNKDFVLRWRVAGKEALPALVMHRDGRGGFFLLTLHPPAGLEDSPRQPVEFVFLLDTSGSMSGSPLAKAKAAAERAIRRLSPGDTFQIIRFANGVSAMGEKPVPATPENVRRGLGYLGSLGAGGGTMMENGIRAALEPAVAEGRRRFVMFMTDGYIGNEDDIFDEVRRHLGGARIFSFGVGTSVNRHLMEGLARLGRGAVAYVGLGADDGKEVDLFFERVRRPALADVSLDFGGVAVRDVYPKRVPDLFDGRPVTIVGRFDEASGPLEIRIRGTAGGEARAFRVSVDPGSSSEHPAISRVWARLKIAELDDFASREGKAECREEAKRTALDYGLVSAYTSFVAVDASKRTQGDHGTTVPVPVPVPEGVRYDTTVPEGGR